MKADLERFTQQLIGSGLMTQPQVNEFLATLAHPEKMNAEQFAREFVRVRGLTRFAGNLAFDRRWEPEEIKMLSQCYPGIH